MMHKAWCNIGEVSYCISITGGTARWLQLQPSSAWPRRRKRSKMFSLCTIQITHTVLLWCIWNLDFNFKILLVLRRHYLISIRCYNGKRKIWPRRWLHHFDFQHWRWLHALLTMAASYPTSNFLYIYTADPPQTSMHIGCIIVVKCDTCKIFGAYAQLNCLATSIVGNVSNRHRMQVTLSKKERMFLLFHPQLKIDSWKTWRHKLKLLLSVKYIQFQGMVVRLEQCAKFETISSIMPGTHQLHRFHQFQIG